MSTTTSAAKPRTLFEKIWTSHLVRPPASDTPAVLYVDLHLIHEVIDRGVALRWPRHFDVVLSAASDSFCNCGPGLIDH